MGIRNLKSTLKRLSNVTEFDSIPSNSTLLIDGNGFIFYIIELLLEKNEIHYQFGGRYDIIIEMTKQEILKLESFGLNLIFYFDGNFTRFKAKTLEKRRIQDQLRWKELYKLCQSLENIFYDEYLNLVKKAELPKPFLFSQQFRMVLSQLGVAIHICDDEADQNIAIACMQLNKANNHEYKYFCYANDTDFLIFNNCPYIEFGGICGIDKSNLRIIVKKLWLQNDVCKMLSMSDEQLIEWVIFVGNDFFDEDHRKKLNFNISNINFINIEEFLNQHKNLLELRDFILFLWSIPRANPYKPLIYSKDANVQLSIDYTRALYNLQSLIVFPYDKVIEKPREFFGNIGGDELVEIDHIIKIVNHTIEDMNLEFPTSFYIQIITEMMQILQSSDANISIQEYNNKITLLPFPRYHDVQVSRIYQKIWSEFYSLRKKNLIQSNITFEPRHIYDGIMFHYKLFEARSSIQIKDSIEVADIERISEINLNSGRNYHDFSSSNKETCKGQDDIQMKSDAASIHNIDNSDMKNKYQSNLPIDSYREEILSQLANNRVTIICGGTGCGKSSRLPMMIYEDSILKGYKVKVMVAQPRRIAARALYKHLNKTYGADTALLRLGGGVKEGNNEAKITFCTTGYLVRYIGRKTRSSLKKITHFIIDEVHERSIDNDVLLMIVKLCLDVSPHIKVILMSATVHIDIYSNYFYEYMSQRSGLFVGKRCYPSEIQYLNSFKQRKTLTQSISSLIRAISPHTSEKSSIEFDKISTLQCEVFIGLLKENMVAMGTAALVFLNGMSDILSFSEQIETLDNEQGLYKLFYIHSEISMDEQEMIFEPCAKNEIKIILSTNIAESSITIPDVDLVVCSGFSKTASYDQNSHQLQFRKSWISKASATQRAGRTGRVRPGRVIRLYTEEMFESFQDFSTSEIRETPLHDVILKLRFMFEDSVDFEGVSPILANLIEPPENMVNFQQSLDYLHYQGLISENSDDANCVLTQLGRFVTQLPLDIATSRMVAIGCSMDILPQAIILASAANISRSLFRIANPLIVKDLHEYHQIIRQNLLAMEELDEGIYSEPIMLYRAFIIFHQLKANGDEALSKIRYQWIRKFNFAHSRFFQFVSQTKDLLRTVYGIIGSEKYGNVSSASNSRLDDILSDIISNSDLSLRTLTLMRLLLLWSSNGNLLTMNEPKSKSLKALSNECISIEIVNGKEDITPAHWEKLFGCPSLDEPSAVTRKIEWRYPRVKEEKTAAFRGYFSLTRQDQFIENLLSTLVSIGDSSQNIAAVLDRISLPSELEVLNFTKKTKEILYIVLHSSLSIEHNDIAYNILLNEINSLMGFEMNLRLNLLEERSSKVFVKINPSKNNIRKLQTYLSSTDISSIFLNIHKDTKEQHSTLMCYKYHSIPITSIEYLFFNQVVTDIIKSEDDKYKIYEQITTTKGKSQKLEFPFPNTISIGHLFPDAPIGYRLINMIRDSYRDKTLIMSTESVNSIPVKMNGILPLWNYSNIELKSALYSNSISSGCRLDRYQIESTRLNLRMLKSSVHAIAHNVSRYVLDNGSIQIKCSNITILPIGDKFTCLGAHCMQWIDSTKYNLTSKEKNSCNMIHFILKQPFDESGIFLEKNKQLVSLIDELFGSWMIES